MTDNALRSDYGSISNWLNNLFRSSDVPRRTDFPTNEEVMWAQQYDPTYGDPNAGMLTNPNARATVVPIDIAANKVNRGELIKSLINNKRRAEAYPTNLEQLDPKTRNALYAAWLASRRSALASLGFNINKMTFSPDNESANKAGAYMQDTDQTWTQPGRTPSNPVHESMHRGIAMMGKKMPLEESIVRQMMVQNFGDVEAANNPAAVQTAKHILATGYDEDAINELEQLAAQILAQRRPRGPR